MKRIMLVLLMFLAFSTAASAMPCTISLNPSEKTSSIDDTFSVSLYVTIVGEADTVAVDHITWDGSMLVCINITRGDLFPSSLIWLPGTITTGQITNSVMASNIPIANTNGIYSTLTFRVIDAGDTTITLSGFGVARTGVPLETNIIGGCYVSVNNPMPPVNPPNPPPPTIPPVIPPANNTNNTPPIIPPVNPPTNNTNDTNETIPPTNPPIVPPTNPQNNSNNSTPASTNTDNANFWYFFVPAGIIVVAFVIATPIVIAVAKKRREQEKDIFDEDELDKKINDVFERKEE